MKQQEPIKEGCGGATQWRCLCHAMLAVQSEVMSEACAEPPAVIVVGACCMMMCALVPWKAKAEVPQMGTVTAVASGIAALPRGSCHCFCVRL